MSGAALEDPRGRVVVFASTRAYVRSELVDAARSLGVELVWATDRCHVLAQEWAGAIPVNFSTPGSAAAEVASALAAQPVHAVLGTDELTAEMAAMLATRLGIDHHGGLAAARAGDKLATRHALTAAGCKQPLFVSMELAAPSLELAIPYPVVVKPRCLSGSRGVMRADNAAELEERLDRLRELLDDPELRELHGSRVTSAVVESFVPGPEVAFEGLLEPSGLRTLAIFDKPDPLDGPTFAETLYVTPSQHPPQIKHALERAVAAAAAALGLRRGPIHAELRFGSEPTSPIVIELAARSIGGLCGRTLQIAGGHSVATRVLASLCGIDLADVDADATAPAGVLMIPVEEPGVLVSVDGLEQARRLEGIVEIEITAPTGRRLLPLPEGNEYIGFAFARGDSIGDVTATLHRARELLRPRMRRVVNST